MRVQQGGTQVWCPECHSITVCKGINPHSIAGRSGQRWHRTDHKDINWFRRGRICQSCDHQFLTAELNEEFVEELVELREALGELKQNAEGYVKQSTAAAKSLEKLSRSLNVLRALKIYKKA